MNDTPCIEDTGDEFIECIEKNAPSRRDVLVTDYKGKQIFPEAVMVQTLELDSGIITSGSDSSDEEPIVLNNTLFHFWIFLTDPVSQFFSDSQHILPLTILTLKKNPLYVNIKVDIEY